MDWWLVAAGVYGPARHQSLELTFRELEALACALLAVLFTLFGAGIAREQSGFLELFAQLAVEFNQRAGNAVADCASLSCGAAAGNIDQHVEFRQRVGHLQRLADDHPQRFVLEIIVNRFAVDFECAGSRPQVNPCGRTLPASRSVVLNISHV
jgi:hypothetical protein